MVGTRFVHRLCAASALIAALSLAGPSAAEATPESRAREAIRPIPAAALGGYLQIDRGLLDEKQPGVARTAAKAAAIIKLVRLNGYFSSVDARILFYDDPAAAARLFKRYDDEVRPPGFDTARTLLHDAIDSRGRRVQLEIRCVIHQADRKLDCFFLDPRSSAVVLIYMSPTPADSERNAGEHPVQTAFRVAGAQDRVLMVTGALLTVLPGE